MTTFLVHTIESAPEHSKPALRQLQSAFGLIPNLVGKMATSPVLIDSLVGLFGNVHGGSFTEAQVQSGVAGDLPRVNRAIRTAPREAARTRRVCGIRSR